ncbi:MAG: sulfatase-like hydrolase/transferase, partial [Verrucomicrobiota bacterium]|nr:sulfatase-like hydrolase/transferase [Verrucomicrobiota bacterium]
EHRQTVMNVYADSLAYVDSQLARLFEHIKRRGLWDNTIVILSADTGQAFYEHGFAGHANMLFNEVMHVPLIIRAPGAAPRVDTRVAQHIDVPPSILHLLCLPPHPAFQGMNLFEKNPPKDRSVYLVVQAPLARQYAIVRSGYKLVYDAQGDRRFLFDLKRDPGERNDVADSHPELARRLAVRLDTWRKLQIEYYRDLNRHGRFYPPVLKD